ncbi:hypothetical protein CSKR_203782 [Clonorchis sinensis]|uniref:Uncharacterized protein n=1 Tax=Clonorchis sinensis TaxID=79923 RepID=A0A8T1N040_CLOSI|nr:hypothetical protein CSKR_203782 [Clonorchis sinensis]
MTVHIPLVADQILLYSRPETDTASSVAFSVHIYSTPFPLVSCALCYFSTPVFQSTPFVVYGAHTSFCPFRLSYRSILRRIPPPPPANIHLIKPPHILFYILFHKNLIQRVAYFVFDLRQA